MIPISDEATGPRHSFPVVNLVLIAASVVVFFYQVSLNERALQAFIVTWGVIPREITTGVDLPPVHLGPVWITLFTSMFMHGGWLHLLGNMLYLFIFGDNVENALGHVRYLVFYLVSGILAAVAQIVVGGADSTIPSVGASGAIAGVLGAYLVMFPVARVNTVIFFGFFFTVTTLPAIIVIGLWGISQFFTGIASLGVETTSTGGVAYWAHVGGFVAGLVLGPLLRLTTRK